MFNPNETTDVTPCWNCSSEEFTTSSVSHNMAKQVVCASCYETQDEGSLYEEQDFMI